MKSILERKQELDLLIDKYSNSFKEVRLEYNLIDRNNDINTNRFKQLLQYQSIENSIENVYVKMLQDVGIDVQTQSKLKQNEKKQIKTINKTSEINKNLETKLKNKSYVQNGALERRRITQFRLTREKICLSAYLFLIFLFLYVTFRDIKQIDQILFKRTQETDIDTK
jgi:hypothetical protein